MGKRFVSIWFQHLTTDWMIRQKSELKELPFVMAAPQHGRMVVKAVSHTAAIAGIEVGMVVADCRAILPALVVLDDVPEQAGKLLAHFAEWLLRYTPVGAVDTPDGIILDVSGCTHLWAGERPYLKDIVTRLRGYGYHVRAAMADTIGTAWAIARYGRVTPIIETGGQAEALLDLPPAALRLEQSVIDKLIKLGLYKIGSFIKMPHAALRRRFGQALIVRLQQALGNERESIIPITPIPPYQERLPSLEPIRTATGIEIALKKLLGSLCARLVKESKGVRKAFFRGYRIDGIVQQIEIGTNSPSRDAVHLFRLFALKIETIRPALGIELFLLEATIVEDMTVEQEALWNIGSGNDEKKLAELLDRIGGKIGMDTIHRYLPDEHYWPERSYRLATSIKESTDTEWQIEIPRPISLLQRPELIQVTVPIPDYPPMLFKYKGELHKVKKADGPERIEREWWLDDEELHRDYYSIEDETGARFWIFRLGHYASGEPQWFVHGFFA